MAKVAVLLGGKSAEREISLTTGKAVATALRALGHEVAEIDAVAGFAARLAEFSPDAAFIALHGRWGEDGTVQGLLEMLEIPYTGSGVAASALAMDKTLSKAMFSARGVKSPAYQLLGSGEGAAAIRIAPPYVIKPPREGSSLGVIIVKEAGEAAAGVLEARKYSGELLVEQFIDGRELTVSVIDGEAMPIIEIVPVNGFYDYKNKYSEGGAVHTCPARLTEREAELVRKAGVAAYLALDCSGAARTDVLLDGAGEAWVLEVNTIPGMTPLSLLPEAAAAAGIDFNSLVGRMLAGASLKA